MFDPIWSILLVEGDYKSVIVGRESGTVEKFHLNDIKGKPTLSICNAHKGTVTTLALSPAGGEEVFSASLDKSICHWNFTDDLEALEGGKRLLKTTLTTTGIRCGVVSGEVLCCGGSDGGVHVLREGVPERWVGHTDMVSCVAACATESGDPLLASGSYDGTIRIWNVNSGITIFMLTGHTSQLKGVQFINGHLGVMGVGRDDTIRLWQLPEELEASEDGGAPVANAEDGEEGEVEGDDDTANHSRGVGPKRIECSAVIGLPAAPLCAVTQPDSESPMIAIGLSGGAMAVIKANKFLSTVSSYTKINGTEAKKERKRLEALLKAEEKKESQLRKKAIRRKKKELIKEQQSEEAEKKNAQRAEKNAARQVRRAAEKNDEEDEEGEEDDEMEPPEEEEPEDEEGEEGEGVILTEERQSVLEEFIASTKRESEERIKSLRTSVNERKRLLEPIANKKFEREAKQFEDLAFTRYHPKAAADSIQCIALNGVTAIIATGSGLSTVDGTPGVRRL